MTHRFIVGAVILLGLAASAAVRADVSCTVHYTCTNSQCASVIGGYNVTKGPFPFASESSCLSQARKQMTNARCNCTRSGGSASSSAAAGGNESAEQAAASAVNRVISAGNFNTANNAAMTMGAGVATGLAVYALRSAMEGPSPAELARREAARREQMRLQAEAEERARLERERRHQGLVAGLQGYQGGVQRLDIVRADAAPVSNLSLIKRGDAAEAPPEQVSLTPFPQSGAPSSAAPGRGGNLGLLKRGDESLEAASMDARKPFDTAGTLTLPPPPPTPVSALVAPAAIAMAPPTAAEIASAPGGIRLGTTDAAPPPSPQATGSASAAVDSIMPNRADRPHVTYGAAVHKPGPAYRPGAISTPGAEMPVQQAAAVPAPVPATPQAPAPADDPFAVGSADGNACRASNSGPVCAGLVDPAWSQCRATYDRGHAAGAANNRVRLDAAYNDGARDRPAGRNQSFTAAPQDSCRQNWIEAYNRGYAGSPP